MLQRVVVANNPGHFDAGQDVGWDQWRFAAQAHHQFSTFPDGGPALEASWSHPTLKMPITLVYSQNRLDVCPVSDYAGIPETSGFQQWADMPRLIASESSHLSNTIGT